MVTSRHGLGPPVDGDVFVDEGHRYVMWDGAYVLGSLSATERREFEAHTAACASCREAVGELSGIAALLSRLNRNELAAIMESAQMSAVPKASPQLLPSLLATIRRRRRRNRLVMWTASVAAAAVLAICEIAGAPGWSPTSPHSQATASALPMAQVGTTLLASTVSVSSQQWGTRVELKFMCMAPVYAHHDKVAMVVLGRDGSQTRLATWVAIPGHTATPTGSIWLPANQIAAVLVVLADNGQVLLKRSV
ncbi:hypothetical protein A9W97_25955 [Mycobacterium gordonae]|nr:hypothetical protein A9W97_25955 [Mycobacterium gordonae]